MTTQVLRRFLKTKPLGFTIEGSATVRHVRREPAGNIAIPIGAPVEAMDWRRWRPDLYHRWHR